jgi:hypothetical protein
VCVCVRLCVCVCVCVGVCVYAHGITQVERETGRSVEIQTDGGAEGQRDRNLGRQRVR